MITAAFLTSEGAAGTLWYKIGHFGDTDVYSIWNGRYWALLPAIFIHINLLHIAFNMYWIWRLGRLIEAALHPLIYLLFIAAAAAVSSAAEIIEFNSTGVGMSGVGYAMFGLMWAARGRFPAWQTVATRENLKLFIAWGIFCLIGTYLRLTYVGNAAHGAGFLFGLSVGWLFFAPRLRPLWAIPLGLLTVMTVLAVTWMPWSSYWAIWKGNREYIRKDYSAAIGWYQRSLRLGGDPETNWENISLAWYSIAYYAYQRHDYTTWSRAEQNSQAAEQKVKAIQSRPKPQP